MAMTRAIGEGVFNFSEALFLHKFANFRLSSEGFVVAEGRDSPRFSL